MTLNGRVRALEGRGPGPTDLEAKREFAELVEAVAAREGISRDEAAERVIDTCTPLSATGQRGRP